MKLRQIVIKNLFDFVLAFICLTIVWPIIFITWLIATVETRSNGLFTQKRIGKDGKMFTLVKIKTMTPDSKTDTTITSANNPRITMIGRFLRKSKIDELPQLWNILTGSMSFVGPRPDVEGYADKLDEGDRIILSVRPGITGPASLKYRNEENILSMQSDPKQYNDQVIWPDKVKINIDYINNWSLAKDLSYIMQTIFHYEK